MKKSGWYVYSVFVWMLAVSFALFAWFTGMQNIYAAVLFLVIPEWFMMIHTSNRENMNPTELILKCPKKVKKIFLCCVVYGILNFSLGMFLLRNGGPHIHEGIYCLWNHGFVREITESEYRFLSRTEGRMFTGNILIFATVAMAFFVGKEKIGNMKEYQKEDCEE